MRSPYRLGSVAHDHDLAREYVIPPKPTMTPWLSALVQLLLLASSV